MAYDEGLVQRIRELVQHKPNIVEKKMFGGIAFMAYDYMCVGILGDVLIARVGPDVYEAALKQPHVRVMDFAKRPMKGYVFVDPLGIAEDEQLAYWVDVCYQHVRLLPVKPKKPAKR
jgi:TfoX/Sxy family transcriptional regulator of competence genes